MNIKHHYIAEKQNHTPNAQSREFNDFFEYFAPQFNTLLNHMRYHKTFIHYEQT